MMKGNLNNSYCTFFHAVRVLLLCAHKVYLGMTVVQVPMERLVCKEQQGSVDIQVLLQR